MQALQGATRTAFLAFFGSHIFFTMGMDAQALLPAACFPQFLIDFGTFYSTTFADPLMSDPAAHPWFQSLIFLELVVQLPFFFLICYYLSSDDKVYPPWMRSYSLVYGAATATSLVPILATHATVPGLTLEQRAVLFGVYLPYLLFPLWLVALAWDRSSTKSKTS